MKESHLIFQISRKEAKAGSKNHFWKISNWNASYAYAENLQRDFNTKSDLTKHGQEH